MHWPEVAPAISTNRLALPVNPVESIVTTTHIGVEIKREMMTRETASRLPRDHRGKKFPGESTEEIHNTGKSLHAISEQSLSNFFDDEPDLYSVANLNVRYRR
jgi:hypothetical protein